MSRTAFAHRLPHIHPVKQHFPGGDRRQRQRRGFRIGQASRLGADDALIHQMILGIRTLAVERAGVEHAVARLEQLGLRPRGLDHAGGVPAEHAPLACRRFGAHAHLGVHRVHRHRLHFHEQVTAGRRRLRQLDIDQRLGIDDRQGRLIADGLHEAAPGSLSVCGNTKAARRPPRGLKAMDVPLQQSYAALAKSSLKPCASASVRIAFSASAAGSSVNGARTLAQPGSSR
jgi:hypothetical protein